MNTNSFQLRHIGPNLEEQKKMLQAIKADGLDQLISETVHTYTASGDIALVNTTDNNTYADKDYNFFFRKNNPVESYRYGETNR